MRERESVTWPRKPEDWTEVLGPDSASRRVESCKEDQIHRNKRRRKGREGRRKKGRKEETIECGYIFLSALECESESVSPSVVSVSLRPHAL